MSTLFPRAGTGRAAARQARPAGPLSTACPPAPSPGPCRAGHTAGTRHSHTPRESTPREPLAGRNARVPRGVTHHEVCWAPRNHTVPSSPCPSMADFVNFLILILFTCSLFWPRWVSVAVGAFFGCSSRPPGRRLKGPGARQRSPQGQRGAGCCARPARLLSRRGLQACAGGPGWQASWGRMSLPPETQSEEDRVPEARGSGQPARLLGVWARLPLAAPFSAASFEGHPLTLCFSGVALRKECL